MTAPERPGDRAAGAAGVPAPTGQERCAPERCTPACRMEHDYATQMIDITAAAGAYVEYLPETTIPFGGSRYYQRVRVTADPGATIVLGEKLMAGRLARGERHAYIAYCADLEVHDPDGLLFADPIRLVPGEHPVAGPAVMDDFGLMASLYVITAAEPAQRAADAMHQAITETGLRGGASVLPAGCRAWARILGDRSPEVDAAYRRTLDAVHELLNDPRTRTTGR
ncbi:urease accessory protein UreD [Actinomadura soli]|uniref:Urease accessory protein UreD n=2 Tax=Actinomadura soli TaxID=2508997 RepID=A0A5C4JCH8_9ACTN|nr:urease accessory protein UreD [Actinomadura soli]